MGKDKSKKKGKGKLPKGASVDPAGLSKKERRQLEERAAELQAELDRKAAKKAAKAAAKPEPMTAEERKAKSPTKAEPAAGVAGDETHSPQAIIEAADKVLSDPNATDGAKMSAEVARSKALGALSNDELAERVTERKAARKALEEAAPKIDRDDHEAVRTYNSALYALGGSRFLTSSQELAEEAARLAGGDDGRVAEHERKQAAKAAAEAPEPIADEQQAEEAAAVDEAKGKSKRKAKGDELVVEFSDGTTVAAPVDEVEAVETETGRMFAAGPADAEGFAKPSEAPKTDFEVNGNGQYKIMRKSDGKIVGFTRATTYIANLEDTSNLTKWKMRMLLEGIAANDTDAEVADPVVAKVADLVHRRDTTIAKARKADRKGKLDPGELATYVEGAWKEYKRDLNELAEAMLDLGGVHEAATKGTDIHALCELADREGIDAVGDLLTEGKITPADLLDVEAYLDAMRKAGIKVIPELIEQVVANDELNVAGRLDRGVLYKFPGTGRAVRCVLDIKTGRIDLGAGKIAQQLEVYASSEGYDLNTHERTDLKLSRTKALVVHLPAGSGRATIHVVDLSLGRKGNRLSGEVRAWRNEGKHAIDTSVDLAAVVPA